MQRLIPPSGYRRALVAFPAFLMIAAMTSVASNASAATTVTAVTPASDSWVDARAKRTNNGTTTHLQIDNSPVLRAYLRFPVSVPEGHRVTAASLTMTPIHSNGSGFLVRTAGSTWSETGITYANAPAPGSTVVGRSGALTSGQAVTVPVVGAVPSSGGDVTLVVDNVTGSSYGLYARETSQAAQRPRLTVTTEPVSQPTAEPTVEPTAEPTTAPVPAPTGTVRYVQPGGSFAPAVSGSAAGDTVVVRNGTYSAQSLSGLTKNNVTLIGESRTGVVVKGLTVSGSSGLHISGMSLLNDSSSGSAVVRVVNGSNDIVLSDLYVAPRAQSGVEIASNAYRVTVRDSTITGQYVTGTLASNMTSRGVNIKGGTGTRDTWVHDISVIGNDIGQAGSDIIQIGGAYDVLIQGNVLHDPQENDDHNDGVQTYGSDNLRIIGNRFYSRGAQGGPDQAMMIRSHPSISNLKVTNTYVANNIIAGWRGSGIVVAAETWTTTVVNNTGWGNGGSSLAVVNAVSNMKVFNNVFDRVYLSGSNPSMYNNCISSGPGGSANISADPQFADTTWYRLKASSPCVNHGTPTGAPATDFGGAPRGAAPDAGAWEVVS